MTRGAIVPLLFLALFQAEAIAGEAVQILATKIPLQAPPYELIQFVTEGEPYGPVDQLVRGRFQRLVVLSPTIAYNHPTLRLETLTYGDEACCLKLVSAYELPIERLGEQGVALPQATTSEFRFQRWIGNRSMVFSYGKLTCTLRRIGSPSLTVACKQ